MKKAEISIILMTQIFRLVIAAIVIIFAVSLITRAFSEENFKSVDKAMKELSNQNNQWTSEVFIYSEEQFGVFFRSDSSRVVQLADSCWKSYLEVNSIRGVNPESDCLRESNIPVVINKPSNCGKDPCYCLISAKMNSGDMDFEQKKDSLNPIVINKNPYEDYLELQVEKVSCKNIDLEPAKNSEITLKKNVYVIEYTAFNVHSAGERKLVLEDVTQHVVTNGGVIMTPISGQSYTYYFNEGSAATDGFFVCKHAESCDPAINGIFQENAD